MSELEKGMLVQHVSLGLGKIVALEPKAVHVFFVGRDSRFAAKLRLPDATQHLRPAEPGERAWLGGVSAFTLDAASGRYGYAESWIPHEEAIARFLETYPKGFADPLYTGDGKGRQARPARIRRAHDVFAATFGDGEGERMLAAGSLAKVVEAALSVEKLACASQSGADKASLAPGLKDPQAAVQVAHHLLLSHGLALQAMRAAGVKAPLGIVLNQSPAVPATDRATDLALAEREYALFVRWFMDPIFLKRYPTASGVHLYPQIRENDFDAIAQPLDFLGINYYTRIWVSSEEPPRPAPRLDGVTDMGWEVYPQGLADQLASIHRDYKLPPIYITENGMANADTLVDGQVHDAQRIAYLKGHLEALSRAIEAGVDVRGFFYWSLLDNYEWDSGYAKRFGLIHVDYATQQRTLKDSAHWYREFVARQRAAHGA